jgi:hypothetical protein
MKKVIFLIMGFFAILCMSNTGCQNQSSNTKLAIQQETLMQEAVRQVGMPNIVNFTQRKQLKEIQELCDQENLICYAYIVPELTGKPVFLGKCIGFGIPASTQYTNPDMDIFNTTESSVHFSLPQADPNGLFMPSSSEATWLLLIDPKTNEPHPVYCEPRILVSPFLLPNAN